MLETPANPPVIDRDGSHWKGHGHSVYHQPNASSHKNKEERLTAASVNAFSYANPKLMGDEKATVLLNVTRQPFHLSLNLEPDDADMLAAALQQAAQEVRAVRAILADRAAKTKGPAA